MLIDGTINQLDAADPGRCDIHRRETGNQVVDFVLEQGQRPVAIGMAAMQSNLKVFRGLVGFRKDYAN